MKGERGREEVEDGGRKEERGCVPVCSHRKHLKFAVDIINSAFGNSISNCGNGIASGAWQQLHRVEWTVD